MNSGKIVWLASYPKSGNTWLRFLLATYLRPHDAAPVGVDELVLGRLASLRPLFDEASVVESSDLTDDEIARSRADVFRLAAETATAERLYFKVHDLWGRDPEGRPLFPPDVTRCSLYVVRNPLDVAVSLANHLGVSTEEAATRVCSDGFHLRDAADGIGVQLPQHISDWSRHARSWMDEAVPQPTMIRFEDLKSDPETTFTSVLLALGEAVDPARVRHAVRSVSFDDLQSQERERGFSERSEKSALFFRGGRVGDGLRDLAPADVDRILTHHEPMMRRLGYLDRRDDSGRVL